MTDPAILPGAWTPDRIPWQEIAADGSKYALLDGDKAAGVFAYAFFLPAGLWDPPHWHTQDSRVFVATGTLQLGYGDVFDRAKLGVYPAGSFLSVPANTRHFDGADVDTLIFGVARGPWATHYVGA
jgi:quercetin dioxygenase-like cupin family protein